MPTVDFIPFATGGGANVEPQASYATDAVVGTGFQPGIAPSAKFNKVMRQSSMVAAAIAHFISNELSENVLDDGNLTALITQFTDAIGSASSTTTFSSRAQGVAGVNTSTSVNPDVLAQSVQGGTYSYATAGGSANALTLALVPAPVALVSGMRIFVKASADNTGAATINVNGLGAVAIQANGSPLASGAIQTGLIYPLIYDGAEFQLQATIAQTLAGLGGQPALTATANGFGLAIGIPIGATTYYLQCGSITVGGNSDATITYPVSVSAVSYCVVSGGAANNDDSTLRTRSTNTFGATVANSDSGSHTGWWISVGY